MSVSFRGRGTSGENAGLSRQMRHDWHIWLAMQLEYAADHNNSIRRKSSGLRKD